MKKIIAVVLIVLAAFFIYRSYVNYNKNEVLKSNTALIVHQLKNVSKLVVTEGHFAEVFNYKDSQQLFGNMITADKKALVVVNAYVTISYDLSQLEYDIDEKTKTLEITKIPEPELNINPDFEYYDVTADYFNPFSASDYNKIKKKVLHSLTNKVADSPLKKNAKNRLISELSKFYILTNSLGWTLTYKGEQVTNSEAEIFLD